MAISGKIIRSVVSNAANRYHTSGLSLPGSKTKTVPVTKDADIAADLEESNDAGLAVSHNQLEDRESPTMPPLENNPVGRSGDENTHEPSESPTPLLSELPNESKEGSNEKSTTEPELPPEENAASSLADILSNPPPPPLNVDNMISDSLGNIFQKTAVKDPILKAMLDQLAHVDMRDLADKLKEFADEMARRKQEIEKTMNQVKEEAEKEKQEMQEIRSLH